MRGGLTAGFKPASAGRRSRETRLCNAPRRTQFTFRLRLAAWVSLPEAALTVSVYTPAGVPDEARGTFPLPPQEDQNATESRATASPSEARRRARAATLATIEKSSSQNNHEPGTGPFAAGGAGIDGGNIDLAVVVTDTVTLTGVVPLAVTEPGVTVHVAACGAPSQASFTVPVKPGVPFKLRV